MKSSYLALVALFTSPFCLAAQLDGAALYHDNCSQCHGERGMGGTVGMGAMMPGASGSGGQGMMNGKGGMSGKGGPGMMGLKAPKLVGDASAWEPEFFERAVLQGIDDEGEPLNMSMPHWGSSSFSTDHGKPPSKEEIDAIQQYLQAQK
ncbi:c-type cytochrome [Pseudomonas sp. A-RE-19]|uniref:c-type cytochrome n=1 Tax=Pseudomonas sp. A-RE-19 TaxID=2832401 RepID=UPI001CBFC8B8|nr:cytochrome c [Pseudomonas sp. A-RE-19]